MIHLSGVMYSGKRNSWSSKGTRRGEFSTQDTDCGSVEEVERGMIRVVNLDLMGGVLERIVVFVVYFRFFLLVVSGCTGGYGDLEERVRCVFMRGRDLEPSRIRRKQKFDLSEDSISAFRFLWSLNGQWPISKNKGIPPL